MACRGSLPHFFQKLGVFLPPLIAVLVLERLSNLLESLYDVSVSVIISGVAESLKESCDALLAVAFLLYLLQLNWLFKI